MMSRRVVRLHKRLAITEITSSPSQTPTNTNNPVHFPFLILYIFYLL